MREMKIVERFESPLEFLELDTLNPKLETHFNAK